MENLKGHTGVGERIKLRWVLRKQGARLWTGFSWLRIGTSDGLL
jgi:hypothetical protein